MVCIGDEVGSLFPFRDQRLRLGQNTRDGGFSAEELTPASNIAAYTVY